MAAAHCRRSGIAGALSAALLLVALSAAGEPEAAEQAQANAQRSSPPGERLAWWSACGANGRSRNRQVRSVPVRG
ncbi:MAG: hypothetical protein U5R48_08205 [Gammaproteobacteria bacterium]|nr:hypothetical protein [Gammaproteobacteria bacterium]